ncbi:hypothetical protein [Puia dinghuensis]|nr:hypothetical protein [Puia dinghuensis]
MKKQMIKPSPALLQSTATYVKAMAYTQTIRPIIESIQKKQLSAHEYRDRFDGNIITEPKHAFAMPEADHENYVHGLHQEYIIAGFHVEYGECPLLIAENLERQARDVVIKLSLELNIGINIEHLYSKLEWLDQYTELLLNLLVPQIDPSLLTLPKPNEHEQ